MTSDESELAEVARDLEKRRPAAMANRGLTASKLALPRIPAAADDAELERRAAAARDAELRGRIAGHLAELERIRGDRYVDCRLANFEAAHPSQADAVARLRTYCSSVAENVAAGLGVFLFGPCGTGKDHLAMAVARAFILATGKRVAWSSGALLFEALRDSYDGRRSEGEVLGPYARAPMLWLSDPLPALGELKEYKAEALYRLVDGRYSNRLPTIVTANMQPKSADAELTPAIARRLRESTLAIHCNWPPYRRPSPPQ